MALFQKLYQLKTSQFIPAPMDEVWEYFSAPENLQTITPDYMGFEITSKSGDKMYPGMIITYLVSPVMNIKMRWATEITQVKHQEYFIDEQRFGPYNLWHHQHHFKEMDGGVLMNDIVHYGIPFGPIGQLANTLFVKKQLREIFDYRIKAVEKRWPGEIKIEPSLTFL